MMRVRALNESSSDSDSGNGSDSQVQLTREAQEQQLYGLYHSALQQLKAKNECSAKETLSQLLHLIGNLPDGQNLIPGDQLRFLTCKNLGLITAGDISYFLDALQIDASDAGLWIRAGIRAFDDAKDYQLARNCFEAAHSLSPNNWIVIDRLLECHFVLHDLVSVVDLACKSLQMDRTYAKGAILLNEACCLNPVWKQRLPPQMSDLNALVARPEVAAHYSRTVDRMRNLKLKRSEKFAADELAGQPKRPKIGLSLENGDLKLLGHKIHKLHEQMVRDGVSLTLALDVVAEKDNACSSREETPNGSADESNNSEETTACREVREKRKAGRSSASFPVEFLDKRRSSRVQRLSKGLTNEQTVFENLLQLIPDRTQNRVIEDSSQGKEEIMKNVTDQQSVQEIEKEIVKAFVDVQTLRKNQNQKTTIFDLMRDFLVHGEYNASSFESLILCFDLKTQVSKRAHQITVPAVFTKLYDAYRLCRPLPQTLSVKLGRDVTICDVYCILTANELNFRVAEEVFLSRLLPQLEDALDDEKYTQLQVRVYFMRGVKGKESDCLEEIVSILTNKAIRVEATNHLVISIAYVKSLIGTQCASDLTSLLEAGKLIEIINSLVLKPLDELSSAEEDMLFKAIVKSASWERGVQILNKRDKLDEKAVKLLLSCVETGQRAKVSLKLAHLLSKNAVDHCSTKAWCCLYWIFFEDLSRDKKEDDVRMISFLSTGHQFLGKKGICTGSNGEFLLLSLDYMLHHSPGTHRSMDEFAQDCFSCLFRFPLKRAPPHGDAVTSRIKMTWDHADTIYGYFVPESLPEYDSNKTESIDSDTEQLLSAILKLVPHDLKPEQQCKFITKFLNDGDADLNFRRPEAHAVTSSLYYLLADYFFKNKEFKKAKYFYIQDLGIGPDRFDSWAGLSLTRSHQLEQQLSKGDNFTRKEAEKFFRLSEATFRCFERALLIDPSNAKLWIEFGNLSYNVASQVSRIRKAAQSLNQRIRSGSEFDIVALKAKQKQFICKAKECFASASQFDLEDEQWLPCYMQGKIMERSNIIKALRYYEQADLHLQQAGASYPRRIAYHTPPHLAIEALEVHYRSFASVLKYLTRNPQINRRVLARIKILLVKANHSAFVTTPSSQPHNELLAVSETVSDLMDSVVDRLTAKSELLRRDVTRLSVSGIRRCLTRFPEHYKSLYRLAYQHYGGGEVEVAQQILLTSLPVMQYGGGSSQTAISGLFSDRKPNNLFNGIWRIPIDEIDRPGSFSSHMQRSAYLLIRVSAAMGDCNCLCSVATQLSRVPETGKKYLREGDRLWLAREAFDTCTAIIRRFMSLVSGTNQPPESRDFLTESYRVCERFIRNNVFAEEANRLMADFSDLFRRW